MAATNTNCLEISRDILYDSSLSNKEKLVFFAISDPETGGTISCENLAQKLGITSKTVSSAFKELENKGLIKCNARDRDINNGRFTVNKYRVMV